MADERVDTLEELNGLLGRLQALRSQLVRDARDELVEKPGQAELINQYIAEAEQTLMKLAEPQPGEVPNDGGLLPMIGLGDRIAKTLGAAASTPLVPNYDDQISRERIGAIADLYYIYQMERLGAFRAVLKLQQLFRSGEVKLSDGPGAMALFQYDRKRLLRYTLGDRKAAYRKVFGYTDATPPEGAEPNDPFHALMSNFCRHVSNFFQDKRVSEVVRPNNTRESFGSMAIVRRAGLDLRHNLKQVSYGHVAVLRSEVLGLLRDAFEILNAPDVRHLFGADTGWDVLEEVLKRYLQERPISSQRNRMAVTGRDILRWLGEEYILTDVRTDFEALLEAIVDAADDWLTSTESVGLRTQAGGAHVIDFRATRRLTHG
ncbi:hypothetical protein [Salipiger mangrovisoli]|uniref:Uncharacterized protein n=1 Tax=Salipiger mangrovisoli TaxID=2865933 RepID=A0ABR9X1B5_9RHOB|nr:hypothetical protein [Salipiger mangrovisoli]MBE9637265.1 hypothetical protein [Salipiger mangrovisoli]